MQTGGQINDRLRVNHLRLFQRRIARRRRKMRRDARLGSIGVSNEERLFVDVRNHRFAPRKGIDRDIFVEVGQGAAHLRRLGRVIRRDARLRFGQDLVERCRAFNVHADGDQMLHGLFRFDPRSASAGPARPCDGRQLQPQTFALQHGMFEIVLPGLAHEGYVPARHPYIHIHVDHATDSGALHGLEIGRDPLFCEMAVHVDPVDPGLGCGRGIEDIPLQIARGQGGAKGARPEQHEQQQSICSPHVHSSSLC